MTEELFDRDVLAYFESIQDLYPGGIPVEHLNARKVLFISDPDPLAGKNLLEAAIVKGLQWKLEQAELLFSDDLKIYVL